MLFVQSERCIQLKNSLQRIVSIHSAINSSALIVMRNFNIFMIVHISKDGEQLYRLTFNQGKRENQLVMINSNLVAFTSCQKDHIKLLDLSTYKITEFTHIFRPSSKTFSIFYFQATQLICIAQSQFFQISYYSLNGDKVKGPDDLKKTLPNDTCFSSKKYTYFKGDKESTVICLPNSNFNVEYRWNLICVGLNGFDRSYSSRHLNLSFNICNVWAPSAGKICYVALSSNGVKLYSNNNKSIDSSSVYTLRESHTDYRGKSFNLGQHSLFFEEVKTFNNYQRLITKNSNIFSKQTQFSENLFVFRSKKLLKNVEFAYPLQQEQGVIIPTYDEKMIRFTEIRLSTMKEIELHFMLSMYEDFDQDLLFDASELLSAEK